MSRKFWIRASGLAVIALVLSVAVGGCAAVAGNVAEHGAALAAAANTAAARAKANEGRPTKGECWTATLAYADGYATWGTRPPVGCDQPHQLYTFAVPALTYAHRGAEFTAAGYAETAVENDALSTCQDHENSILPDLDLTVARVYLESYLPEKNQWNAGARWVRCDIAIVQLGSPVAHPELESLPSFAVLVKSMTSAPTQFDFCVNDTAGAGLGAPKDSNSVFADCRDNPQWRLELYGQIVTGTGDEYPTPAQLNQEYLVSCEDIYSNATHITYVYYPSKTDWDNGDEQLECWVGVK